MFVHVTSFAALMHTCEIYRQSNRRQIIEALAYFDDTAFGVAAG